MQLILFAGLHWCHDARIWSCEETLLGVAGLHEDAQLFINRRFPRVFISLNNPSLFFPSSLYLSLSICMCVIGLLFNISQHTWTWLRGKKRLFNRGKLSRKVCNPTKTGPEMVLSMKPKVWCQTDLNSR